MPAQELRNSRRYFHRNYLWLFGIVFSIIFYQRLAAFYPALILLLLVAGLLSYWRCFREVIILVMALLLGYLAAVCNGNSEPVILQKGRWTRQNVVIADSGAVGEASNAEELLPERVRVNCSINGKKVTVQLYFPEKTPNPGVSEGEKWQVSGNFYQLGVAQEFFLAHENGTFQDVSSDIAITSYRNYLRLNKISGVLVVDAIKKLPDSSQSTLTRWRRSLLQRLDCGMESAENRALLGAVVLGIRSRLPGELKRQFSAVGAGHLFSVSGLHVGVMALLILLVLRPLPSVLHYWLLSMLAGYVLLTGGNAPAVRAFAMVWMLEFFRSKLLHVRSLEILSLIASVLLLYDADFLCDGGFQYSFVITAVLISAAPMARELVRSASGAALWWGEIPWWKKLLLKLRGELCGAVFFAAAAALVSCGLMLFHQNMFFAGSMAVNLLILPILTPLFAVALLKLLLPWGDVVWNSLLNGMLEYLRFTVNIAGEFTSRSSYFTPAWWVIMLFILLLFIFLTAMSRRWAWLALCGIFLIAAWQVEQKAFAAPQTAVVISGGRLEHPVLALLHSSSSSMYLLNAGRDAVEPLDQLGYYYGINKITRLDIAYPVNDCVDGINYLQKKFVIGNIYVPTGKVHSKTFKSYIGNLNVIAGSRQDELSIADSCGQTLKLRKDNCGGWGVSFDGQTYKLKRTAFPRTVIIPQR